jgi:hypothetical protein
MPLTPVQVLRVAPIVVTEVLPVVVIAIYNKYPEDDEWFANIVTPAARLELVASF